MDESIDEEDDSNIIDVGLCRCVGSDDLKIGVGRCCGNRLDSTERGCQEGSELRLVFEKGY